MKTILVPLDGSELSEAGVRLAKLAAGAWNADIELMHVVRDGSRRDLRPRPVSHDGSDAERYLRGVADRHFDNEHVGHVTTSVLSGDPVEQILARAEAQPDQLLAMSTRGRSGFERFAFGSVADKLLRSAPVPLIIVRGDAAVAGRAAHDPRAPRRLRSVRGDAADRHRAGASNRRNDSPAPRG